MGMGPDEYIDIPLPLLAAVYMVCLVQEGSDDGNTLHPPHDTIATDTHPVGGVKELGSPSSCMSDARCS